MYKAVVEMVKLSIPSKVFLFIIMEKGKLYIVALNLKKNYFSNFVCFSR